MSTQTDRRLRRVNRMVSGPIVPTLARLAAPNVVGMVAMALMSIAEAVWAARMGPDVLAAIALVFPFQMLTQTLAAGAFGGATNASMARALGARDIDRAGLVFVHALVLAVVAATTLLTLFLTIGRPVFVLLGGRDEVLELAMEWSYVFFPGTIGIWLSQLLASLVRGTGDMVAPAVSLIGIALVSSVMSGTLALGWGPFPALGIKGLALGFLAGHVTMALVLLIWSGLGGLGFPAFASFRLRLAVFEDILGVALVSALSPIQTILTTLIVTGFVARYGAETLAGFGLGARLEFLMIPVAYGFGTAATAMVGTNIGAGQYERAKRVAWIAAAMAAALISVIGSIAAAAPWLWLDLFINDRSGEIAASAASYLRCVAPFYGFFGLGLTLYFASQGAGLVFWPVMATTARLVLTILGGAFAIHFVLPLPWLFATIAFAMICYGISGALAVYWQSWDTLHTHDDDTG